MASSIFDSWRFNDSLFFPSTEQSKPPPDATDLHVNVDGASLHVRMHAGDSCRFRMMFFHGNGEVVAHYDHAASRFASCGAALSVMDYRGYGMSTGEPTLRNTLADAAVIFYAVQKHAKGKPLVVMGRSLGGTCAARLCGDRVDVAAFILESAPASLVNLVARRGLQMGDFTDDERNTFDPLPKFARCNKPMLILHGEEDRLISCREAQMIADVVPHGLCKLVLLDGVGHNDIGSHPRYWTEIAAFLDGI